MVLNTKHSSDLNAKGFVLESNESCKHGEYGGNLESTLVVTGSH